MLHSNDATVGVHDIFYFAHFFDEGHPDRSMSSTISHPFLNSLENMRTWQRIVFLSLNQGKHLWCRFA